MPLQLSQNIIATDLNNSMNLINADTDKEHAEFKTIETKHDTQEERPTSLMKIEQTFNELQLDMK